MLESQLVLQRDGVRLAVRDFGGTGPPVLLLHGLAGHGGEWDATAAALRDCARVVAFDARGHGGSERFPDDVTRQAHVADAAFVMRTLRLEPTVVVGQSVGGVTALLLAAEHPRHVRGLVVAEASADSGGGDAWRHVERSLRSWPVPFGSRSDALAYFSERGFPARAWADGLEKRDGGWWPRFDIDVRRDPDRDRHTRGLDPSAAAALTTPLPQERHFRSNGVCSTGAVNIRSG
jgi:pimeloyl-ACP methyl ester carboxylesterase